MSVREARALQPELVAMRRDLHKIPELGLCLPKTRDYVIQKLEEMGVEYTLNKGDSGIVAYINKGKSGKCVALRADMDALPIREETGVEYASTHEGQMHGCGHDAHISMLLGAIKLINAHKDELNGEIRFLFQTAEEISKGAAVMIENGALNGVDAVFGTHIGTLISERIPAGTFIITPGPVMASFDRFVITVKGKGCHGSVPENGIDPINIAAHIVLGLEAINAREFNANVPVVITIGKIQGGKQYNVIPDDVVIEGTTRAFSEEVRQKVSARIEEISKAMAAAYGASVDYFMDWGAPTVINDREMAAFAANCAKEVVGEEKVITHVDAPSMVGEDFALYLNQVPGAFLFLSSANHEKGADGPHHNSRFNIDEDVLWEGSALFFQITEKFLNS